MLKCCNKSDEKRPIGPPPITAIFVLIMDLFSILIKFLLLTKQTQNTEYQNQKLLAYPYPKNYIFHTYKLQRQSFIRTLMLEDRFYQICKQNYPIRVLPNKLQPQKVQRKIVVGITPAIFLSPFYMKKGDYSMEVSYGQKQKNYKPLPEICPVDFDEYEIKNLDQTMNQSIKQRVVGSQCKNPKNITSQSFKHRQSIQSYLNNLNFHWFQDGVRSFYHALSMNQSNFKKGTLEQPKGLAFILEVNDKTAKQNFEKIKKQTDTMLKRMYYLNPSQIKQIPIMVAVLYDPNKKYSYTNVKAYTDCLKSDFNIQGVLTAKNEINGPLTTDLNIWSNYTRSIFNFNYKVNSSDTLKLLNQQGAKSLYDIANIHKQRMKKNLQGRIQALFKRYDEHYSMGNKLFGFFKGNTTPKQKYLVTQQAEARQLADLLFLLEDYKKAHDIYNKILKYFEKRDPNIQMELRYVIALCFQMGKFVGQKVSSTAPKQFLQKEAEQFEMYEKLGRKQLTKLLILFLFEIHTFKIFDPNLIKDKFLLFIKRAMNMSQEKKPEQHKNGTKYHFLVPTLLYQQYSNINLLYSHIDYRRYCYDTVRVSMKYAEYRLYTHALRCMLIVEGVYTGTVSAMEKYIAVHLSSDYVQNRNFQESLAAIKKAWKILAENTTFSDYYIQSQSLEYKKMLANHGKIITQIQKLSPDILNIPDDKSLVIPHVVQTDVRLVGEEEIHQIDRTGVSWTQISEYFNQNTQLYSEGYNKAAMEKIFKLFDCTYSEQKQLIYRTKCQNLSPSVIAKYARTSYVKQPIRLCFTFQNPFIQEIIISDFNVLIKDSYKNFGVINPSNQILTILPHKKVDLFFQIIPKQTGLLEFQGLEWTFLKMRTKYSFREIRKVDSQLKPFYFIVKIVEPKGKLKVHQIPQQQLFQGQKFQNKVVLQNCGEKPIQSVYIAFGCDQFYGKKYQKLNVTLQPQQKKQIKFELSLPSVLQNIKKDWKLMDKKIFLYRTQGQFRVHRSSVLTLINKILYHRVKCQKLSTHLHLLTFTHDKSYQKQALIESMIIKQGFEISKVDRTQFQNTETYFFFLLKNQYAECEVFNFQTQSTQQNFSPLKSRISSLKRLSNKIQNIGKNQQVINLVFGWRASGSRSGLVDLKPLLITSLKQQILPFSFFTTMPFNIKHDFRLEPVLQKNFEIRIKNIFHHKQVGIKVQLVHDNVNGVYWEGITQRYFKLKHDEQISFDITIIISKPGVYDISDCIRYTIEVDRKSPTIKHSQHQKLLMHVVDNSSGSLPNSSLRDKAQRLSFSDNFQIVQSQVFKKKTEDQITQVVLLEEQDAKLMSSPRYSNTLEKKFSLQKDSQGPRAQQGNLIDLL